MTKTVGPHDIGQRFRERRQALGLTRKELAQQSGTGSQTIMRFELYGSTPIYRTLRRWSVALGIPISELIAEDADFDDGEHTGHAN